MRTPIATGATVPVRWPCLDSRPEPAAAGWFSVDPLWPAGGASQHHGAAVYGKAAAGSEYLLMF